MRGASTTANTPLQLYTCNKGNGQYWNLSALESPRGAMSSAVAAVNQVCLQDHNGSTASGSVIEIAPCTLSSRQIVTHASGTLRLYGQCVGDAAITNGAKIGLYRCSAATSQLWTYRTDGSLLNAASGKCLDIPHSVATPLPPWRSTRAAGTKGETWRLPG